MNKLGLASVSGVLVLTALIACDDSTDPLAFDPNFDAGNPAPPGPSNGQDAAPPTDAAPDVVVTPAVSVTVTSLTGPKQGVRVIFNDAQGAVIESKTTGADGKATHEGTNAVTVSALLVTEGDGVKQHIVTWTGVEVGDNLKLVDPGKSEERGMYSVTLPSAIDGTFQYSVTSPCSNAQPYGLTAMLGNWTDCARPTNSVLAYSRSNGENGDVHNFSFKKGNTVPATGEAAVATGAWAVGTQVSIGIDNIPEDPTYDIDVDFLQVSENFGFRANQLESETPFTFITATGFADGHQGTGYFRSYEDYGKRRTLSKRVAPGTAIALDTAQLLPEVGNADIDASTLARPVLSWEGDTSATDGGIVRMRYRNETAFNYWTVIVRPGATSVTMPVLPDDATAFLPDDAGALDTPDVIFFESDLLPTYKEFRNQQGAIVGLFEEDLDSNYQVPALPSNGSLRATSWRYYQPR